MEIGIVGKPNVGKSTFFSAATLAKAEIASYPFTTIEPNRGVAYVRAKCPHPYFNVECNPKNAKCVKGTRYVPVEAIDVAGLVPDAHKGKGLGNKFLDDLRQASALIHIVDVSGGTDLEGNPCSIGSHDPVEDVLFLEKELTFWIKNIIEKDWKKISHINEKKEVEKILSEKLTGLGISEPEIKMALHDMPVSPKEWDDETLFNLASNIRKISKPIIIAANKCDIASKENLEKLKKLDYTVIPTSAESELALRKAGKAELVDYDPGSDDFKIIEKGKLNEKQIHGLDFIREKMKEFGGTGIQTCIETAVFKLLDILVVYPVEDENKLTDKDGNVLPDAYLMKKDSTALELAYKIHTDIGKNFIRAIDAKTKRIIGADHILNDGDVIKIVAKV